MNSKTTACGLSLSCFICEERLYYGSFPKTDTMMADIHCCVCDQILDGMNDHIMPLTYSERLCHYPCYQLKILSQRAKDRCPYCNVVGLDLNEWQIAKKCYKRLIAPYPIDPSTQSAYRENDKISVKPYPNTGIFLMVNKFI